VRYDEPRPFMIASNTLGRACPANIKGENVLLVLLDAVIDRAADILERVGADVDKVSHDIFDAEGSAAERELTYRETLKTIGRKGDLSSKVRESLVSIGRLLLFLANEGEWQKDQRAQLSTMQRDVQSLSDHVTYLSNKITFLLDAILGMVSLEQNKVIKIFSVVAVVLLPPTMVASIYGMNFKYMPELTWEFGYPLALLLMLASAILPYQFFKWRGWL
jgi:magnesium transporter